MLMIELPFILCPYVSCQCYIKSMSHIADLFLTSSINMNKSFIKNHINEYIKNQGTQTWLNDINRPESKR